MSAVPLDRQTIARRDFPIVAHGYDPEAVDAHLRALADEFERLRRSAPTPVTGATVTSVPDAVDEEVGEEPALAAVEEPGEPDDGRGQG